MATVRLSDIIDVVVFNDLPSVNSPEKTAFYQSGIVVSNPLLNSLAAGPGKIAELPFWRDLDATSAPNLSSDDPSVIATPDKITQGEQIARKAFLNKGWSASDLATELAMGPRAMDQMRSRIDAWWVRQWQRRLIASANGIIAGNVANNAGDMVIDVSAATATATSVFTRQNFTSAAFTLGDAVDGLVAVGVHSIIYKRMIDNDDVDFIPDSQGNLTIPTYLGKRVIVDDGLPVDLNGTNDTKYTTVLFGAGAFGYGDGSPIVPVAIEREEAQGNGAGIETLWTRKTQILHPFGFAVAAAPAGNSYTLAELALAATWTRVVDRKSVPMAFLITN
jgi:hypothetical protein